MSKFIWSKVDRCIFTEDDQIMSISFFEYCRILLEEYKNDQRIECICGMNHLGASLEVNSDYFFSKQGSIWGFATWKRVFEERGFFGYSSDKYTMELLKQQTKGNKSIWKRLVGYAQNKKVDGHVAGDEFWIEFDMYSQNRLQIIPKYNMVSNIGYGNSGTHSDELSKMPRRIRKLFCMKTYEIDFPLVKNRYVIPDVSYERRRNKLLYYNQSFFPRIVRKFNRAVYLFFTDFARFKEKIFRKKDIEK